MKYTTKIKFGEWEDGDIICFLPNSERRFEEICQIEDGKILEMPNYKPVEFDDNTECFRIDYDFISDGTWYISGTKCYPEHEIDSEDEWRSGIFRGYTIQQLNEDGSARWDGEVCSLEEFKIVKRK